jgi:hypothetical protein
MLKLGHMRVKSFLPLTEMNLMVEHLVEIKIDECWFEQRMCMDACKWMMYFELPGG